MNNKINSVHLLLFIIAKGRLTSIVEDWSDILSALDDKSA